MKAFSSAEMRELIHKKPCATVLPDDSYIDWRDRQNEYKIKLSRRETETLINLKETLLSKSAYGMLQSSKTNLGLIRLAQVKDHWIGSADSWKRKTNDGAEQFNSLLKLMIESYKAPRFLRQAWTDKNTAAWKWHLHLTQGGSPRKLHSHGMPYALTRNMTSLLDQVPAECGIGEGFRWVQVKALGGSAQMFHAIAGSFLRDEVENDEYWCEVISWLVRQQDVDLDQVAPVLDYLRRGIGEGDVPLKGRTWKSVTRRMELWHNELHQQRLDTQKMSSPYGIREKYKPMMVMAKSENGKAKNRPVEGLITKMGALKGYPGYMVTITQILSRLELYREGNDMDHCVASYHSGCAAGTKSIWSLRVWNGDDEKRLLTIELHHECRTVVQVRGKCNRRAKYEEMAIVEEWAKKEKLKMGKYL